MGDIVALRIAPRRARRWIGFDRSELARILSLYATIVAEGLWRDYALDSGEAVAAFSIYRHAAEKPIWQILKLPGRRDSGPVFVLFAGPRKLRQSSDLNEILAALRLRPLPPRD